MCFLVFRFGCDFVRFDAVVLWFWCMRFASDVILLGLMQSCAVIFKCWCICFASDVILLGLMLSCVVIRWFRRVVVSVCVFHCVEKIVQSDFPMLVVFFSKCTWVAGFRVYTTQTHRVLIFCFDQCSCFQRARALWFSDDWLAIFQTIQIDWGFYWLTYVFIEWHMFFYFCFQFLLVSLSFAIDSIGIYQNCQAGAH